MYDVSYLRRCPHSVGEVQEEVSGQAGAPTVGECDALAAEMMMQAQK